MILDNNYKLAGFDLDLELFDIGKVPKGYKIVLVSYDKTKFKNPKLIPAKTFPFFSFIHYLVDKKLRNEPYYYECKINYPGLCD